MNAENETPAKEPDSKLETWRVTLDVFRNPDSEGHPANWNWEELVGYGTEVVRTRKIENGGTK